LVIEYAGELFVRIHIAILVIALLPYLYLPQMPIPYLGYVLQFRKISTQSRYNAHGYTGVEVDRIERNPVSPVCFTVKVIITQLVPYDEEDNEAGGNADGQTENIQQYIIEIALNIPEGNNTVALEHGTGNWALWIPK
jgi:hypothetical protein